MIAEFKSLKDADILCEKIHEYLQNNCPRYSANIWQKPIKHEKLEEYYVMLPREYEKEYYVTKTKVKFIDNFTSELSKSTRLLSKLPSDYITIKEEMIDIKTKSK